LVRENPDPPMTVIARVGREGVECGVAGGTSPLRHETAGRSWYVVISTV
jgi:hypothetical protein